MSQDIYDFIEARIAEARVGTEGMRLRGVHHLRSMFDAMEAVLDFHKNWPILIEKPARVEPSFLDDFDAQISTYQMSFTREYNFILGQEYMKFFDAEPPTTPMLRRIASIWSAHPDFKEEWALTREEFQKALGQRV